MRGRRTWPFPALAALLWAAPAPAQPRPRPESAPARPVYSLVTARETRFSPGGHWGCVRLGGELICPRHSSVWFDRARSLAGPPVEADLAASTEIDERLDWYEPVLFVMLREADDPRIVAQATADPSGLACITRAELDRLGWHPAGPGIVERDGGACADLSPLFAIWAPDPAVAPILTPDEVRRLRPSLILGRLLRQRESDLPPCPENVRCWRVAVDARIVDVETLSGPPAPPALTVFLGRDTPPPDSEDMLMVVTRGTDGRWLGVWTWPVAPAGRETCFETNYLEGYALRRPRRAHVDGDHTCIDL